MDLGILFNIVLKYRKELVNMKQYSLAEYEEKRRRHNQRTKEYYYRTKEKKMEKAKALAEKHLVDFKGDNK